MEAFDAATMFAISTVLLVLSAVGVNADVPDGVVYTDVRKIVIAGDNVVLKCQFHGTPLAVYWKKGSDPKSAPNLITWFGDTPPTGSCVEDGACEMTDEFSLILKEVGMEDQGRYICRVSNYMAILIYNFTDVKVIDPDQLSIHTDPYVIGWAGSSVSLPCNFTIEARKVIWERVYWDGGSKVETILRYTSDGYEAPAAKRYSWSENYGLIIRDLHVLDEGNFTCLVSSIDGIEIKNSTVLVVNGSAAQPTTSIIVVVIIVIIVVVLLVLCIFVMIRTRQYKSFTKDNTDTGYQTKTRDWFCWVFCWKKPDTRNTATEMESDTERQRLMKQEEKLDDLRKQLKNYDPKKATDIEDTKEFPRQITLGVFGVLGVGKSSLINSLKFALENKYEDVAVAGDGSGTKTLYRDSIHLTKHIEIRDNRGMRNFSEKQIKDSLMPQIRGERGLDPLKEIENGVAIHCPIFVHNISGVPGPMYHFLKQFTSAVLDHYGRHVMVVFTHKEEAKNFESFIDDFKLHTDVPKEYIWSFENYTGINYKHDVEKSTEYLEFLKKCVKVGERNIRFTIEKNNEIKKNIPNSRCLIM